MKARWMVLLGLLTVALVAAMPRTLPRNKAGRVQYVEVTEVPGVPPTELMKRARLRLAE